MTEMVTLGRTDLKVSRICFGCWQMARNQFWPTVDEQAMNAAVHRALDAGVNFFDTADAYGDGFAEELLGRILKGVPRDRFILADKISQRAVVPLHVGASHGPAEGSIPDWALTSPPPQTDMPVIAMSGPPDPPQRILILPLLI